MYFNGVELSYICPKCEGSGWNYDLGFECDNCEGNPHILTNEGQELLAFIKEFFAVPFHSHPAPIELMRF